MYLPVILNRYATFLASGAFPCLLNPIAAPYLVSEYVSRRTQLIFMFVGLNSGVIFMDLDKMRKFGWLNLLEPIYMRFKSVMTRGDQDVLNAIFHFFPGSYGLKHTPITAFLTNSTAFHL